MWMGYVCVCALFMNWNYFCHMWKIAQVYAMIMVRLAGWGQSIPDRCLSNICQTLHSDNLHWLCRGKSCCGIHQPSQQRMNSSLFCLHHLKTRFSINDYSMNSSLLIQHQVLLQGWVAQAPNRVTLRSSGVSSGALFLAVVGFLLKWYSFVITYYCGHLLRPLIIIWFIGTFPPTPQFLLKMAGD